jgi:phosphorylcholine metabolism protein LicD
MFNSDIAKIYFRILNQTDLEYYVFAGSAIGMLRNGKNIPWVDDYDIIIFQDQIEIYKRKVIPLLSKHGINTSIRFDNTELFTNKAKIFDYNEVDIDVFTSYKNSSGYVKCINNKWGRYSSKNIHIDLIKPAKYMEFDNMGFKIPFFNDFEKDIEIEYGDVIDKIDIHVKHRSGNIINKKFSIVYKEFDDIVSKAILNTKNQIKNNEQHYHKYLNKLVIKNKDQFSDRINYYNIFIKIT